LKAICGGGSPSGGARGPRAGGRRDRFCRMPKNLVGAGLADQRCPGVHNVASSSSAARPALGICPCRPARHNSTASSRAVRGLRRRSAQSATPPHGWPNPRCGGWRRQSASCATKRSARPCPASSRRTFFSELLQGASDTPHIAPEHAVEFFGCRRRSALQVGDSACPARREPFAKCHRLRLKGFQRRARRNRPALFVQQPPGLSREAEPAIARTAGRIDYDQRARPDVRPGGASACVRAIAPTSACRPESSV